MTHKSTRAFTIIEVLMSVAALALIAGIGVPVYLSMLQRNDLSLAASTLAQNYRRAQVLSQASDGDSSWGVSIGSTSITVFRGASYAARNDSFDENSDLPTDITPSGVLSVVFSKFLGLPQTAGTTTFINESNETRAVNINAVGTVSY